MIIIQNADRKVSARDYEPGRILVSTMFSTIQGEGPYAGYPALFVRLAGCNFGDKQSGMCSWCDTSFKFAEGKWYTPQELRDAVINLEGYNSRQVLVITGGEPTLQMALLDFIALAAPDFKVVQLETNGTQPKFFKEAVNRGMLDFDQHLFETVVSPKANENIGRYPKISDDVLRVATCLKFVVTADPSSVHHTIPGWAWAGLRTIYVSPMAVYAKAYEGEVSSIWDPELINHSATAANYKYAAEYAMKHQLLLSLQTHLFIGLA